MVKQLIGRRFFKELSKIHDRNIVRKVVYYRKVVRDEEIRESKLILQILHQIEDLRLNGDVKRGDRLVANNEVRIHCQCTRNTNALPTATVQLMRVRVEQARRKADRLHQFQHTFLPLLRVGNNPMQLDWLLDRL